MSTAYRQTLSDELTAKVEETRRALGLSIQEITILALALFCQDRQQPKIEKPQTCDEGKLSF